MKTKKPIIYVTGPDKGGFIAWIFTSINVKLSGGNPIRVQPKRKSLVNQKFDGIIFGGGTDIGNIIHSGKSLVTKTKYKQSLKSIFYEFIKFPIETLNKLIRDNDTKYDNERDLMELSLFRKADGSNLPILGICRGHQLINVSLGGCLLESTRDIYRNKPRVRSIFPRKTIKLVNPEIINKDLKLNTDHLKVNALHDQSISKPGSDMNTIAKEKNGIIQATKHVSKNILTVQWHPEYLPYLSNQRKIFNWIVEKSKWKNQTY